VKTLCVTNGQIGGYAYVESDFYQQYVAPNMAARAYKKAFEQAEKAKRPWWKRLLRIE